MSVSAVLNAELDWPGSSPLVPDVDSLCCQGVCTFHSYCLHQESLMPGLYLWGNENMYSPLHSREKDTGVKFFLKIREEFAFFPETTHKKNKKVVQKKTKQNLKVLFSLIKEKHLH